MQGIATIREQCRLAESNSVELSHERFIDPLQYVQPVGVTREPANTILRISIRVIRMGLFQPSTEAERTRSCVGEPFDRVRPSSVVRLYRKSDAQMPATTR